MSASLVRNAAEVFFYQVVNFFSDMGRHLLLKLSLISQCATEYENSNKPVQNIQIAKTNLYKFGKIPLLCVH